MVKEKKNEFGRRVLTNYLESNNHRKTPERYCILDAVYSFDGHFSLDELSSRVCNDFNFPVSRATLYNTIRLFIEIGLVFRHNLRGSTMYEAWCEKSNHCHQVCNVCGKVSEIKSAEIVSAIDNMHLPRFKKEGFALYIYGVCQKCKTKMAQKVNKDKKKIKSNNNNEQR